MTMEPVNPIVTASARQRGSALILAVVLTSLLAVIGVLFVLAARIDKLATSATTDSRELDLAANAVLAEIDDTLIADVPGIGSDQEYYDYPDANNAWLASAEPYQSGTGNGSYYWRQISNGAGMPAVGTRDVRIRLVGEREAINPNDPNANADADGDGVGDARWFEVPGVMSSRGRPIYAAVRILDNGGMLNVNTGYKFDPTERDPNLVNGSSQLQVNLLALGKAGDSLSTREATLRTARASSLASAKDLTTYERQVLWKYPGDPDPDNASSYLPFDLADELELRYRFLLNRQDVDSRLETWGQFRPSGTLSTPVDSATQLGAWFGRVTGPGVDPNCAYRTIATTYNADRIITPKPWATGTQTSLGKMVNVNTAGEAALRAALAAAISEADPSVIGVNETVLQITANLQDYIDDDDEITVIPGGSSLYYGFERPCLYLSEIAYRQVKDPNTGELHTSYAIELYKPYFEDRDPQAGDWELVIDNPSVSDVQMEIAWSGSRRFHVLLAEDSAAPLKEYVSFRDAEEPTDTMPLFGYSQGSYGKAAQDLGKATIESGATISLRRRVRSAGKWIVVDYKRVPDGWITADGVARSLQRDISAHKCIRRLWDSNVSTPGLGNAVGNYVDAQHPEIIQAHPANKPLTNIGELGMILARSAYSMQEGVSPAECLIDLRNPAYRKLFDYLTVLDPSQHARSAGETRVMGRINVNTAPAFVLAQLPWMQYEDTEPYQKAKAIVAYRDNHGPYQSIGDLMQVDALRILAFDGKDNQHNDNPRGPDLTPDTACDDMEERNLIFTRISNLVTVRSDVFTAYVLVRIGTNGPQKRIMAILDRSKVNGAGDKVRIAAQWSVPDSR
ncbi:MAG: helix-hairpin-helix domain-containing protein [Phycisphaerae bacterium]|nr:helix-hairpin-helix domain-containing protein [Phycisphaerae bacterium]